VIVRQHIHLGELNRRADANGTLHVRVVADAANQHGVTHDSIALRRSEDPSLRIGEILREARRR
jgi:hypothetical protein